MNMFRFQLVEKKVESDYIDGDELECCKCDRFVSEINNDGFCLECEEEEKC